MPRLGISSVILNQLSALRPPPWQPAEMRPCHQPWGLLSPLLTPLALQRDACVRLLRPAGPTRSLDAPPAAQEKQSCATKSSSSLFLQGLMASELAT